MVFEGQIRILEGGFVKESPDGSLPGAPGASSGRPFGQLVFHKLYYMTYMKANNILST